MTDAKTHFSEIRAYLNKPKTGENWKEMVSYCLSNDASKTRKFVAEYKPAVLESLDANWPDELRVVGIYDEPHVHDYARVMRLSFYGSGMQSYGAQFGKSYKNTITKKLIKEMTPHWMPRKGATYTGLVLDNVDKFQEHLLRALLDTGKFDQLEYVRFTDVSPTLHRNPYGYAVEHLSEMVHALIDLRGQTLRSFGGSFSSSRGWDRALYGPLLERAGDLPNLTALSFSHENSDGTDVFYDVMRSPDYDRLDTLSFTDGLSKGRALAMMNREASLGLRRVGVGGVSIWGVGIPTEQLVDAANLANVEAWDIRNGRREDESWDTQDTRRWADHKRGVQRDELAFATVDLNHHTAPQTHATLFDDDGALRHSTTLRALRIGTMIMADLFHVIDHAHEAWPNLECLVFQFDMNDEGLRDAWNDSQLIEHLKFLDWYDLFHPIKRSCNQGIVGKDQAAANQMAELERALDGSMRHFMAFRHWRAIKDMVRNKPHASALARRLGLSGYSKLSLHELLERCEVAIIEQFGGRERLLLDGPVGATGDWNEEFRWASPTDHSY